MKMLKASSSIQLWAVIEASISQVQAVVKEQTERCRL